jgi:hypothetical protein
MLRLREIYDIIFLNYWNIFLCFWYKHLCRQKITFLHFYYFFWGSSSIEFISNSEITIYPNPNNGIFKVISTGYIENIEISSIKGKRIKLYEINGSESEIDISSYASGFYLVRINISEGIVVGRIVKR